LHRLRLGAKLGARIFIDGKRAVAQLLQLLVEDVGAGIVAAAFRLVVGKS